MVQTLFWTSIVVFSLFYQWFINVSITSSSPPTIVILPIREDTLRIVVIVIVACLFMAALTSAGIAATIDSRDPAIFTRDLEANPETTRDCTLCACRVNKNSLHCRYCDKCILRFDHHCHFLNTCIGARNYRWFVCALVSGCFYFILHSILSWFTFSLYIRHREALSVAYGEVLGVSDASGAALASCIISAIYGSIDALFAFFLLDLTRFHIVLKYNNMTSLEYFKWRRRQTEVRVAERVRHKAMQDQTDNQSSGLVAMWNSKRKVAPIKPLEIPKVTDNSAPASAMTISPTSPNEDSLLLKK